MEDRVIGFNNLKEALPEEIQEFIQGAHDQLWSFVPNPWRTRNGTLPPELFHKFSDMNRCFPNLTNYQVAKQCIEKATEAELYQEAIDVIFIVDRYAYWMGNSETSELLDKIQQIVDNCPEVAVAPQLILRKVRWLNDRGDYQSADKICVSVLSQAANCVDLEALVIGTWSFKSRKEFLHAVSAFLMLRGIIQMNLAQPVDATVYLAASCQLTTSATLDGKAFPQCLQVFTDVFLDMANSEREEVQSVVGVIDSELPLIKYLAENAARILNTLPSGDLHFLKQIKRLTRIELEKLIDEVSDAPETEISRPLLHLLKSSIPETLEWAILQYPEIAHDFATSVFNVHLAFKHFGHSTKTVLLLSKRLFIKSCGSDSKEDYSYFQQELARIRVMILNLLDSVENDRTENPEDGPRYPILRDSSPIDLVRDFRNPAMSSKCLKKCALAMSGDTEPCHTDIDPVATTFARSGVLPSIKQNFKPKLFQSNDSNDAVSIDAEESEELVHRSLVRLPTMVVDGFSAPQKLYAIGRKREGTCGNATCVVSGTIVSRVLQTKLTANTVYGANVARYYPSEDQWRYQKTLVFIHSELQLTKNKKGQLRDVIRLQYLHQGDFKAMYLGKLYRGRTKLKTYHDDVIVHQISLQCVSRFNKVLQNFPRFANRIRMVPVVHMEILDETDCILEVLNVEPFIHGSFTKMTNNLDKVNTAIDSQLLLAFSHFTWCDSDGKLMVTDLQGWIPADSRVAVILTDPAINSEHLDHSGITNMGRDGFKSFWTKQHPTCNEICHLLKLERDSNYP